MTDLPVFGHRAYGLDLDYIGEDGEGILAHGHVDPRRFIAGANHMARKVCGLRNVYDDRSILAADVLGEVRHRWAVNDQERADADGYEWWLSFAVPETPGAFPVTHLALEGL